MSFNFSVREAKAFHRSLEAQVPILEGSSWPSAAEAEPPFSHWRDAELGLGTNSSRGPASNTLPPWMEGRLDRNHVSTADRSMADYLVHASTRQPTAEPYVPLAERRRHAVADETVDRDATITQGPISAWAERVARRQLADVRLPTATRSEAEAMAAQTGMIAFDIETDPRMAPHRVYRPPVAPPQGFLNPQVVEQMRHENMRTMEELRAADRDYVRYPEEVTLSRVAREYD